MQVLHTNKEGIRVTPNPRGRPILESCSSSSSSSKLQCPELGAGPANSVTTSPQKHTAVLGTWTKKGLHDF